MIPSRKKRPRMGVRQEMRIKSHGHCKWVRTRFECALAGKISKRTGLKHECWGPMDAHHSTTRGAGGGDETVVPLCRGAHTLLDSPGHSQKSVEHDYGVDFKKMGADLWQADKYHRVKWEAKQKEIAP